MIESRHDRTIRHLQTVKRLLGPVTSEVKEALVSQDKPWEAKIRSIERELQRQRAHLERELLRETQSGGET